ncbi:MAG: methyltransferase domain-containing protein [Anaerolineae bacterium]|nr:methyltransferase domain-containing protein [Anaerolineae bacterium]
MNLQKWRDILRRFSGAGVYPHELAFLLDTPLRHLMISPRQLADRLHLSPYFNVLEIGPGPGFFSLEVARRIPNGRLALLDIQHQMLAKCTAKLARSAVKNYCAVQGSAEHLPFASQRFDAAFMVTVLGEVPQPRECLSEVRRLLQAGGLLSITEQSGDPDLLSPQVLQNMAADCGFVLEERFSFRGGFTLNFRSAVPPSP